MELHGIGASAGISIGKVLKIDSAKLEIKRIDNINPQDHLAQLASAIETSKLEISKIKDITFEKFGNEKAAIFDAHLLILEDPEIKSQVEAFINDNKVNASFALKSVMDNFITLFESMDDEYMKERALDIKDVFTRVLNHLEGIQIVDLSLLDEEVVLVADDLTPSQAAIMNKNAVIGFLTDKGGKTSHTAIMARSLEIPAVVGLDTITSQSENGSTVVFDGKNGDVYLNPNQELLSHYKNLKEKELKEKEELFKLVGVEAKTTDGFKVEVAGNIGSFQDLDSFFKNDAESVGLYRTEFLFLDRDSMPSEDEQFEEYKRIIQKLDGKKCVIRTLDIGGDKNLPYLKVEEEENPFLGYRAIRICLDRLDIFKTQLRALLRASVFGPTGIMFPMISSLEELNAAKEILNECKTELNNEGQNYSSEIKLGIMIEIPSAALMADLLAKHVDFFSMGTNDLTQYTCAVDRINQKISHLYNPFNPGLLRLIKMTADGANKAGIDISICGSMAHFPELIPFFIGCKINKLSMSPMHILKTKRNILNKNQADCEKMISNLLNLETAEETKNFLEKFIEDKK